MKTKLYQSRIAITLGFSSFINSKNIPQKRNGTKSPGGREGEEQLKEGREKQEEKS